MSRGRYFTTRVVVKEIGVAIIQYEIFVNGHRVISGDRTTYRGAWRAASAMLNDLGKTAYLHGSDIRAGILK